jgi:hypothetical protein
MPPLGFEPSVPARERPQTYALDRAATGTGVMESLHCCNDVNTWQEQKNILMTPSHQELERRQF